MIRKSIKVIGLALALSALAVPAAFASDGTTVVVTGSSLAITNPTVSDFQGVTLTGVATTTAADLDAFSVTDPRGTGEGWHVTAQATQFTGASKDLALDSLKMSQPTVSADGTTSPAPAVASGPYTIDDASAVTIATADTDEGMGKYDFSTTTLTLSLPANTYADSYASTVTISVVSAP